MGERKVLNKYYPPDFDPAKIPRKKQPKNLQMKVRMMLPMSIRCNTCGNYIYKGTKFNCRKEDVVGETYLGIMMFRFYFKCTKCAAELIMKTDPQNSDYTMEAGASRNFEPWREKDEAADAERRRKEEEELGDAMRALENRTLDSKQEMDIMAALDEMKSMRARQAHVGHDALLRALRATAGAAAPDLEAEDEALIRSLVFRGSATFVRRLEDDAEEEDEDEEEEGAEQGVAGAVQLTPGAAVTPQRHEMRPPAAKRRKVDDQPETRSPEEATGGTPEPAALPAAAAGVRAAEQAAVPRGKSGTEDPKPAFALRAKPMLITVRPKGPAPRAAAAALDAAPRVPPRWTERLSGGAGQPLGSGATAPGAASPTEAPSGLSALAASYDDDDDDDDDAGA